MTATPIDFPLTQSPTAIILNGQRDCIKTLQQCWINYQQIVVCDGAWHDVKNLLNPSINTEKCSKSFDEIIVLGDGDSIQPTNDQQTMPDHFIHIADQNSTDFEKALQWIIKNPVNQKSDNQKIIDIDVYWANGGKLDHTLGNLALSAKYIEHYQLHFYSHHQYYRYVQNTVVITGAMGQTLSLFPFPKVIVNETQGVKYPMTNYVMQIDTQQSLRNQIVSDCVNIHAEGGYMVILSH